MLLDGHTLEEEDFATEVIGSLGDFATTNQFSVSNLKDKLKQKDMLIGQLQNQMKMVEQNVRSEIDKEVQQLKSSLDEMQKNSQTSNELVRQLQAKVSLTKKVVVDISSFQTQALEVHKEPESAQ
jgi:predicted RNase H-like nuclease (RuvC/YqgF family)